MSPWLVLSGRRDLNPGPLAPKASALAGLRYAPYFHQVCEYNALDENPSSDITDDNTALASRGAFCLLAIRTAFAHSDEYCANFNTLLDRNKYNDTIASY